MVGTNSVSVDKDPTSSNFVPLIDVMNSYRALVSELLNIFPHAHIGLFNIPPKRWYNPMTPQRISMFNMFLDECADIHKNITSIRMFEAFLQNGSINYSFYKPDGLHFSSEGTAYITECFADFQREVKRWLC